MFNGKQPVSLGKEFEHQLTEGWETEFLALPQNVQNAFNELKTIRKRFDGTEAVVDFSGKVRKKPNQTSDNKEGFKYVLGVISKAGKSNQKYEFVVITQGEEIIVDKYYSNQP